MRKYNVLNCYGTIIATCRNYNTALRHVYKLAKWGYGNVNDYSIRLCN